MAPYPQEWERRVTLRDGAEILVRPIRPEDEPLYGPFVARVSAEDARMRFFGPIKEFNHAFLERFTHVDYEHAIAFIVRSDLKGHGLGLILMQTVIAFARAKGFSSIDGQVLHENTTMLKMCSDLGFTIEMNPTAPALSNVRLDLASVPAEGER